MTRAYTFWFRKPKDISVSYTPAQETQIQRLADNFFFELEQMKDQAVEIYMAMTPLDLADLLKAELEEAPGSPVSMEIRRRLRDYCREQADKAAQDIQTGD